MHLDETTNHRLTSLALCRRLLGPIELFLSELTARLTPGKST